MDYYIKKEDVLKLISEEYYDKFEFESDADELLVDIDLMEEVEL